MNLAALGFIAAILVANLVAIVFFAWGVYCVVRTERRTEGVLVLAGGLIGAALAVAGMGLSGLLTGHGLTFPVTHVSVLYIGAGFGVVAFGADAGYRHAGRRQ